ncbi:MAG: hypothetical protein ACLR23_14925 [Clostridia bacterium]
MPGTSQAAAPLAGNKDVVELFSILREHSSPSLADFQELLKQVGTMEQQRSGGAGTNGHAARPCRNGAPRHPAVNAMRESGHFCTSTGAGTAGKAIPL